MDNRLPKTLFCFKIRKFQGHLQKSFTNPKTEAVQIEPNTDMLAVFYDSLFSCIFQGEYSLLWCPNIFQSVDGSVQYRFSGIMIKKFWKKLHKILINKNTMIR